MEATAPARLNRVPPRNARREVDLIRGQPAAEAQAVLRFAPQAASEPVGKVHNSAIANATHNFKDSRNVRAKVFTSKPSRFGRRSPPLRDAPGCRC